MNSRNKRAWINVLIYCSITLFVMVPHAQATNKALLNAQEGVAALLRGNYEQAVQFYDRALNSGGLPEIRRAGVYNDRGVAYWRLTKHKEAIQDFNKAVSVYPEHVAAYNNRGNVLSELKHYDEAVKDFDRAIELSPAFGAAYNNRGNANLNAGKLEAALKDFKKAIELMPANAVPFNGRGKTHKSAERSYAALRDFNYSIVLNGTYQEAYVSRAKVYIELEDYASALKDLANAIKSNPRNADLYFQRAKVHHSLKRYVSATTDFSRAIDMDDNKAAYFAERGKTLVARQRLQQAFEDFEQAEEIDNKFALTYVYRAEAHILMAKTDEAFSEIEKALEIDADLAQAYYVRGKIHQNLQQTDKAIADYQKATEINPKFLEAWKAEAALNGKSLLISLNPEENSGEKLENKVPQDAKTTRIKNPEQAKLDQNLQDWDLKRRVDGKYVAINPRFPKMQIALEMYGVGKPKLLEYSPLKQLYAGLGLLRYFAGVSPSGVNYQYIAVVDVRQNKLRAIEPFIWGDKESKWDWGKGKLTVTDPNGIASEWQLRRPPQQRPVEVVDRDEDDFFGIFSSSEPRKRRKRTRSRSFFDRLFDR